MSSEIRPPEDDVEKSLVYMGSFMPYKNVAMLIHAMNDLTDYTLHLLNPSTPRHRAQLETAVPTGGNVIFHNGVSDTTYRKMLARATALVTLSHMEGYGLALVEDMAAGTL